jgi:alpha-glucosidase
MFLGYALRSVHQSNTGLTAQLSLANSACNAFGRDAQDLTIQVTYETSSRYVCT